VTAVGNLTTSTHLSTCAHISSTDNNETKTMHKRTLKLAGSQRVRTQSTRTILSTNQWHRHTRCVGCVRTPVRKMHKFGQLILRKIIKIVASLPPDVIF